MNNLAPLDMNHIMTTGELPKGVGFLSESNTFDVVKSSNVITEGRDGRPVKRMRLTGIVQRANIVNENKRRYGMDVLREAVSAIQPSITARKMVGQLDHPETAKISIDRVSHLMTKVWIDEDVVYGELEVLSEMPCGKMLKSLIDSDVTIGISSRGVGDLKPAICEDTGEEVMDVLPGYRFVTWDVVAEPSVPGAELSVLESIQRENLLLQRREKEIALLKAINESLRSK